MGVEQVLVVTVEEMGKVVELLWVAEQVVVEILVKEIIFQLY